MTSPTQIPESTTARGAVVTWGAVGEGRNGSQFVDSGESSSLPISSCCTHNSNRFRQTGSGGPERTGRGGTRPQGTAVTTHKPAVGVKRERLLKGNIYQPVCAGTSVYPVLFAGEIKINKTWDVT